MTIAIDKKSKEIISAGASLRKRERTYDERIIRETIIPKESWTPVDEMLFGVENPLDIPEEKASYLRFNAIKYAFNYHYNNNLYYHRLCCQQGVTPDDINDESDFAKIPKIYDDFFKSYNGMESNELYNWLRKTSTADLPSLNFDTKCTPDELITTVENEIDGSVMHSSGTSGKFSVIFRDNISMKRWDYILGNVAVHSIIQPSPDAHAIYLGPSRTHIAFGRVAMELPKLFEENNVHYSINRALTMSMIRIGLGFKSDFKSSLKMRLMRSSITNARKRICRLLEQLNADNKQVYIIGSPYDVFQIMKIFKDKGETLQLGNNDSVIITASGWKLWEDSRVPEKAFREEVEKVLGIPEYNCRDIYGMSEWNGLAWECEGHYKHIIQCTYPMVLDDELKPIGYGEYGRFAFLDPLSNTWPGFIITGDRVKLIPSCPVCNRSGAVLEPEINRMPGSEPKSCGNLMRTLMAEDIASSNR
jgi:long-chain-fatty-acid---luciferin-component ligase